MPIYDYLCEHCGAFEAMRPMAAAAEPAECVCGRAAPRVMVQAPGLADMDPARRQAHATNERSAHEPGVSTRGARAAGHGASCTCCHSNGNKRSGAQFTASGEKVFPNKRPWMISH
jgi:putative FmdB family regulatory protein